MCTHSRLENARSCLRRLADGEVGAERDLVLNDFAVGAQSRLGLDVRDVGDGLDVLCLSRRDLLLSPLTLGLNRSDE